MRFKGSCSKALSEQLLTPVVHWYGVIPAVQQLHVAWWSLTAMLNPNPVLNFRMYRSDVCWHVPRKVWMQRRAWRRKQWLLLVKLLPWRTNCGRVRSKQMRGVLFTLLHLM